MSASHETRLNISAGLMSVAVALILVVAKLWALGQTSSLSIAATLADSALDLMVSLGGLAAMIYATKPADDDHAFGHSSAEDLAALGQAIFILISAVIITYAAVVRLLANPEPELMGEGRGIAVLIFSIMLTLGLVLWQRRVIRATGNTVVSADNLHYIGDLIPMTGSILALWASARFGIGYIDSIVALGAAAILAIGALRIGKGAFDALMDRGADPELLRGIGEIADGFEGVHGWHDLKTRRAGSTIFVNLHIELDGDQTLRDAHTIGAGLRLEILKAYPKADVLIHKDPLGE